MSTLLFGEEETRAAWGINLDFDVDDRLLGIESQSDDLAPIVLLQGARRLPPPPPARRGRLLLMRIWNEVRDLPYMAKVELGERLGRRPRKDIAREDDQG